MAFGVASRIFQRCNLVRLAAKKFNIKYISLGKIYIVVKVSKVCAYMRGCTVLSYRGTLLILNDLIKALPGCALYDPRPSCQNGITITLRFR
ncbi:hypothetical protein GWI33_013652 [Rhynchophorus ferrugineus]|uniref:Uncharacterized protein n=1 Tax=Rhynchophorus ferrugineus TaxID=354439 RepID=A0A834MBD8_RHYFE|nr:hypothetical protein GWI33_013652 [Rhynchophorus ferrugineus]